MGFLVRVGIFAQENNNNLFKIIIYYGISWKKIPKHYS